MSNQEAVDVIKSVNRQLRNTIIGVLVSIIVGIGSTIYFNRLSVERLDQRIKVVETEITLMKAKIERAEETKLDKADFAEMWARMYDKLESIDNKVYDLNKKIK